MSGLNAGILTGGGEERGWGMGDGGKGEGIQADWGRDREREAAGADDAAGADGEQV